MFDTPKNSDTLEIEEEELILDKNLTKYGQVRQIIEHKTKRATPAGEVEQLNQEIRDKDNRVPARPGC